MKLLVHFLLDRAIDGGDVHKACGIDPPAAETPADESKPTAAETPADESKPTAAETPAAPKRRAKAS